MTHKRGHFGPAMAISTGAVSTSLTSKTSQHYFDRVFPTLKDGGGGGGGEGIKLGYKGRIPFETFQEEEYLE